MELQSAINCSPERSPLFSTMPLAIDLSMAFCIKLVSLGRTAEPFLLKACWNLKQKPCTAASDRTGYKDVFFFFFFLEWHSSSEWVLRKHCSCWSPSSLEPLLKEWTEERWYRSSYFQITVYGVKLLPHKWGLKNERNIESCSLWDKTITLA